MLTGIRNIIFDLGDVIIGVDGTRALNEFKKLGTKDIDSLYSAVIQSEVFDKLERGAITVGDLRNELRAHMANPVGDAELDRAWNAVLLDIPKERIDLLIKLKEEYRLFLLSNTNVIHINAINRQLQVRFGIDDLSSIFEYCYYSYDMGLRKPEPEIYMTVLNEQKLVPEETLFVDDRVENINAAVAQDIQGCLVSKTKGIIEVFDI